MHCTRSEMDIIFAFEATVGGSNPSGCTIKDSRQNERVRGAIENGKKNITLLQLEKIAKVRDQWCLVF